MKKPQYITIAVAAVALCLLWAFGKTVPGKTDKGPQTEGHQTPSEADESDVLTSSFSIDSALMAVQATLPQATRARVLMQQDSLQKLTNKEEKVHAYHRLSDFWGDSAKAFIPYAWYTGESARLENSEKNLNFAGQLFLDNLQEVDNEEVRRWMALQAKDLFERSLKINPENDSAKVGIGATYLFGGISNAPMQGIAKIREVIAKDSNNVYAQMTLAMGSLMSGQTEKARERLEAVAKLDPKNIQVALMLADLFEKQGDKENAVKWYQKALPLVSKHAEMKAELEKRINVLKKQD